MAEYSRIASGTYTVVSGTLGSVAPPAKFINLPFAPDSVELWNYTQSATPAQYGVPYAYWNKQMGQGFAIMNVYKTGPALVTDVVTSNGISTFSAGLSLQYGALVLTGAGAGAGIAKTDSSTLTVTTTAAHGLAVGDWITFQNLYQTSTTGMQQIAGIPFIVKAVTSTTVFTVAWAGTAANLTAITNAATGAVGFKKILYPQLYVPGIAFPWSITLSAGVVTVYTTAPTDFKVGQEIAFNIPAIYGGQELNELVGNTSLSIPASPNYYYVTEVGSVLVNSTYVDYFKFNFSGSLSAFSVANPAFASFKGLGFAIVKAVGDVNTGGTPYSGAELYPPPNVVTGNSTTTLLKTKTINGPAIEGAYVNNTRQGFIIGAGQAATLTGSFLGGAANDVIYWRAILNDMNLSS